MIIRWVLLRDKDEDGFIRGVVDNVMCFVCFFFRDVWEICIVIAGSFKVIKIGLKKCALRFSLWT